MFHDINIFWKCQVNYRRKECTVFAIDSCSLSCGRLCKPIYTNTKTFVSDDLERDVQIHVIGNLGSDKVYLFHLEIVLLGIRFIQIQHSVPNRNVKSN